MSEKSRWVNYYDLARCLASLAKWCGVRVAIQFISITSTEEREHMQVSSSHHCERAILSTVSILAKGQINEECLLRNFDLRPCVKKILWLLMTSSDGFQESSHYQESLFLFQFRARMSRASNNFCHAGRTKICPRSKSCQSCPLNGHSCSNPVHSNHQYRTESTHASVKQWPLWESHSLHSFHFAKGQINEECLLRNFEKAWVWQTPETLCWDELSCWCCCVKASRNSVFIRNHVACSDSEQEWAEHCTTFAMLKDSKHLWSLVLVQCFASLANWWGVHAAIQIISNTSTADRHMQWPLWENIRFPVFILAKGQINEECLPRDVESWERWT